jgi:hypothetical protein
MIIDPKSYLHYSSLEELLKTLSNTIQETPLQSLLTELKSQPKKDSVDTTWFCLSTVDGIQIYETNTSIETCKVNESKNGSVCFYVTLIDDSLVNTPNSLVESTFYKEYELMKNLPGIRVSSVSYLSNGYVVQSHKDGGHETFDDDDYFYNILLTVSIDTDVNKAALIMDSKRVGFTPNSIFVFDSHHTHSAENFSSTDWIFMTLRTRKKYFK